MVTVTVMMTVRVRVTMIAIVTVAGAGAGVQRSSNAKQWEDAVISLLRKLAPPGGRTLCLTAGLRSWQRASKRAAMRLLWMMFWGESERRGEAKVGERRRGERGELKLNLPFRR